MPQRAKREGRRAGKLLTEHRGSVKYLMPKITAKARRGREMQTQYAGEEVKSCWQIFWRFFSAIWLQVTVLVFVALQVSRLKTPLVDWLEKTIDLLVK